MAQRITRGDEKLGRLDAMPGESAHKRGLSVHENARVAAPSVTA